MATRREILQALAALPVVGLLLPRGALASELVAVEMVIGHQPGVPMALPYREALDFWLRENPTCEPVGKVTFDPYTADHEPWLLHPSWASRPSAENPSVITCQATVAFRRPMVLDRAVDLRLHQYWRAEFPPMPYGATTEDIFQQRLLANRAWRQEQRQRLGYVVVRFDAEPV